MSDPELIEAARAERDRRAETFPGKVAMGGDAEALSIEYQAWAAIAEWLETDTFASFAGGAEPERPDAPWIGWPDLEAAALAALSSRTAKLDALEGAPNITPETLGALRQRRSCLNVIHRRLALHRQSIDAINADLRQQRGAKAVAA